MFRTVDKNGNLEVAYLDVGRAQGMGGYNAPPPWAENVSVWHGKGLGGYNPPPPGAQNVATWKGAGLGEVRALRDAHSSRFVKYLAEIHKIHARGGY